MRTTQKSGASNDLRLLPVFLPKFSEGINARGLNGILFVDLVSDDILQMALWSDLPRNFGGRILQTLLINAICCALRQLAAMPLSTKRIQKIQQIAF